MSQEKPDEMIPQDSTAALEDYEPPTLVATYSIDELRADAAVASSIIIN